MKALTLLCSLLFTLMFWLPVSAHDIPFAGESPTPLAKDWVRDCKAGETLNVDTVEDAVWTGAKRGACAGYLFGVMAYFTPISKEGSNAHEGPFFCPPRIYNFHWMNFNERDVPNLYREGGLLDFMDPEIAAVSQITRYYLHHYGCESPATILPMSVSEYASSCGLVLTEDGVVDFGNTPEASAGLTSFVRYFCVSFLTGIIDARRFHLFASGEELKAAVEDPDAANEKFLCFIDSVNMHAFTQELVIVTEEIESDHDVYLMLPIAPTALNFLDLLSTPPC